MVSQLRNHSLYTHLHMKDYGNYHTASQCSNFTCAAAGDAFLDLCGTTQGGIAQNISTVPGMLYTLSLKYDSNPSSGCSGGVDQFTSVMINGQLFHTLEHLNQQGWHLSWATFVAQFQATSEVTEIAFTAQGTGCGCMLLDDVNVQADCVPISQTGIPATLCNGRVSTGAVVGAGCFANFPSTYNPNAGSSHACLTDGSLTNCVQGGPDAVYTVQLPCRGRVTGSVIITGGPDMPSNGSDTGCGGFQESGEFSLIYHHGDV